jgi:hypothetical protein
MTGSCPNPVLHLSFMQRLAAGLVISQLYKDQDWRFMTRIERIGPRAAVLLTCSHVLAAYSLALLGAGCLVLVTPNAALSRILLPLACLTSFWTFAVLLSANKARKEFRTVTHAEENKTQSMFGSSESQAHLDAVTTIRICSIYSLFWCGMV